MRYIVKFSKTGNIRYISHLDTMRLFQRAFKRADIRLLHSQGFNPHPRMVLAQPLSLGFESSGEYLEFYAPDASGSGREIQERLGAMLPVGMEILDCREFYEEGKKSLAALVTAAAYEISVSDLKADSDKTELSSVDWAEILKQFIELKEIFGEKRQKKTKTMETVDIRPFIIKLSLERREGERLVFSTVLEAGGNGNLNPEVLLKSLFRYAGLTLEDKIVRFCRKELYRSGEGKGLQALIDCR